jgi:hypothetical protein
MDETALHFAVTSRSLEKAKYLVECAACGKFLSVLTLNQSHFGVIFILLYLELNNIIKVLRTHQKHHSFPVLL